MEFKETPSFTRIIIKLATEDEYLALQLELIANPNKGRIIQQTGGARKIRLKIQGRGKSGGARVIYYWQDADETIWLLYAYRKNEQSDLTADQRRQICCIINDIKGGLV